MGKGEEVRGKKRGVGVGEEGEGGQGGFRKNKGSLNISTSWFCAVAFALYLIK